MIGVVHHVTATTPPSFWPATLGAWAAIVAAIISAFAGVVGVRNHNRIQVVHRLVNGKQEQLEMRLDQMTSKRDDLIAEREAAHNEPTGNVRQGVTSPDPGTTSQSKPA